MPHDLPSVHHIVTVRDMLSQTEAVNTCPHTLFTLSLSNYCQIDHKPGSRQSMPIDLLSVQPTLRATVRDLLRRTEAINTYPDTLCTFTNHCQTDHEPGSSRLMPIDLLSVHQTVTVQLLSRTEAVNAYPDTRGTLKSDCQIDHKPGSRQSIPINLPSEQLSETCLAGRRQSIPVQTPSAHSQIILI